MTKPVNQQCSLTEHWLKHISWAEIIAALFCLFISAGYLYMAANLPAGHSRGDVGPAVLPYGVAVCGVFLSIVLFALAMRMPISLEGRSFPAFERVLPFVCAFIVVLLVAQYIGLAVALGLAGGAVTLLFSGQKKWIRALSTVIGLWVIAEFLFARFLSLPLPSGFWG